MTHSAHIIDFVAARRRLLTARRRHEIEQLRRRYEQAARAAALLAQAAGPGGWPCSPWVFAPAAAGAGGRLRRASRG
ncbi:hypothetical protein [Caldimonas brevitalea]|uniref:Uncharacterized protein n=1 Tax=Caldimonas brevitalea TaxID=413882 RepID=A0A0G3BXJ3_9BURK|nr:hypothetical protein [Caldimonas brevitalea]AKJ31250.1 hypothetical protein AAW51_4559 [Caldimonas brevitalea]